MTEAPDQPRPAARPLGYAVSAITLALAYVLLAKLTLEPPISELELRRLVWFPSGIAIAGVLLLGYRVWPAITVGAALGTAWTGGSLAMIVGTAIGNTLEPLAAVFLLNRLLDFRPSMERVRDVVGLVVFGGVLATATSAVVSVASMVVGGDLANAPVETVWLRWWMTHGMGAVVIAPLILTFARRPPATLSVERIAEAAALLVALIAVGRFVFGWGVEPDSWHYHLEFLPYPLMIWAAFRFGQRGATAATLIVSVFAVAAAGAGTGPFSDGTLNERLLMTWAFIFVLGVTTMLLAAVLSQGRRAEEARRQSEARYRMLVEQAVDGIFIIGRDGRFLDVNRSGLEMLGYDRAKLLSLRASDVVEPDPSRNVLRELTGLNEGQAFTTEWVLRRKDGTVFDAEVSGKELADDRVQAMVRDVTERKRAQQALRVQSRVLQSMAEGVHLTDEEGRIFYTNEAFDRMFGYGEGELIGRKVVRLALGRRETEKIERSIARHLEHEGRWTGELRCRRADGSAFSTFTRITAVRIAGERYLIWVQEDVSELKGLEQQLVQAQKMEAIGLLAGGIAHDFNNLLTAIIGHTDFARDAISQDHEAREDLEEVRQAASRAEELTRQLLAFARKQIMEPRVIVLDDLVANLEKMLRRVIGEDIQFEIGRSSDPWPVKVDPVQLEQVILNLTLNAREAMPDGGRLSIDCSNVVLGNGDSGVPQGLAAGPHVLLRVADTGVGMDEETLARIFEPFFTTKDRSKGTGLGLAMSYGIVRQAGGQIVVDSEPGRGTSFTIWLPRADEEPDVEQEVETVESAVPVGSQTVLVVEDEPAVRELVVKALLNQEHRVLAASDGDEALRIAHSHSGPIDLLLTDVVLPTLSGVEVARAFRDLRPGARVILMSGYSDALVSDEAELDDEFLFLPKPFSPSMLARAIRGLFDTVA